MPCGQEIDLVYSTGFTSSYRYRLTAHKTGKNDNIGHHISSYEDITTTLRIESVLAIY